MSSSIVTKSPTLGTHQLHGKHVKVFTPYPFTHTFARTGDAEEILPYMARVQSPVKVTFTPSTPNAKRQSRVADHSRSATFNFRPLRRGDIPTTLSRFRVPDATLPTLQYMSPWISVTKTDFKDPRTAVSEDIDSRSLWSTGLFQRSYTDFDLNALRREMPLKQTSFDIQSPMKLSSVSGSVAPSRSESRISTKTTSSVEKRVTIVDPTEALHGNSQRSVDSPCKSANESPPAIASPRSKLHGIKHPDIGVNYYSGYLPPELSDKIAEQLDIGQNGEGGDDVSTDAKNPVMKEGYNYKPLVGDRSLFMRSSYPVQPKIYQSDIDQLRFEGHERLLQSNGQAPAHFSALNGKGPVNRPAVRGARLDQRRAAKPAAVTNGRLPQQTTSIELFQRQREKTYHLQKLAREMINK